jgi:hypothetical protein
VAAGYKSPLRVISPLSRSSKRCKNTRIADLAHLMNARAIRHVRIAYERFNVAPVPQRSSRAELSHHVTVVS